MRDSIEKIERERLRKEIAEGLEDMAEVYEERMRTWASTDRGGWPEY